MEKRNRIQTSIVAAIPIHVPEEGKKDTKKISLDPNLGLLGYLQDLKETYESNMHQPYNTAPYFLDILPLSGSTEAEDSFLLIGGIDPISPDDFTLGCSIFQYQLQSKKWFYFGCMKEPRSYHAAAIIDNHVYIAGGYCAWKRRNGQLVPLKSVDQLDLHTTKWRGCANMNSARAEHAMVAAEDKLFVFGGRDETGKILRSVEVYDTASDVWTVVSQLPQPTVGLSATYTADQIWILGGVSDEETVLRDVFTYEPDNKSWNTESSLPDDIAYCDCVVGDDDDLWVVGGCQIDTRTRQLASLDNVLLMSQDDDWSDVVSLKVGRHACSTLFYDYHLYIMGGMDSDRMSASSKVDMLDTTTHSFVEGFNLPCRIAGGAAVFVPEQHMVRLNKLIRSSSSVSKSSQRSAHRDYSNSEDAMSSGASLQGSVKVSTRKFDEDDEGPKMYTTTLHIPLSGSDVEKPPNPFDQIRFKKYTPPEKWNERQRRSSSDTDAS